MANAHEAPTALDHWHDECPSVVRDESSEKPDTMFLKVGGDYEQ